MPNLHLDGASELTVTLTIGGGVALQDPELWRLVNKAGALKYERIPRSSATVSNADWIIDLEGADVAALQLYWDAIEPNEPEWSYPAKIEVINQNGDLLRGRSYSQRNPQVKTYNIGPIPPHGGSELEVINAW